METQITRNNLFRPLSDSLGGQFSFARPKARTVNESPLTFRQFVGAVNPRYQWYWHCETLAAVLQDVAEGKRSRVMVFEPPRHGKSEEVSRLFSAYYLYRHPERFVGLNSYAAELAYTLSRSSRDNYLRSGGSLKNDAAAVKQWETGQGGGLWAAGVGGPITGKGFHLGIIDDPVKNAKEASSQVVREAHKDWYSSTFYTRAEPDAAIIIIQTRWNQDDLSGWLLSLEKEDDPERWHIVDFPAIKDSAREALPESCTLESDRRSEGEALCPERYTVEKLEKLRKRVTEYYWSSLYQGRPKPREGGMFKYAFFEKRFISVLPVGMQLLRYYDKGFTADGAAYTVGVLMGRTQEGKYVVVDVVRGQWSSGVRDEIILQTAKADREKYGDIPTWIEQEPGSTGRDSCQAIITKLAGYEIHADKVTGDKETRAEPFASQCEVGNVMILSADWNRVYLEELTGFPNGKYKDQVDATSGAFNKLSNQGSVWTVI